MFPVPGVRDFDATLLCPRGGEEGHAPVEGKCGAYCAALREAFDGRLHYAATTVRRGETVRFALCDEGGALAVFTRAISSPFFG